jgi:hypothetical protein
VTYDPAGHDALLHTLAQLANGTREASALYQEGEPHSSVSSASFSSSATSSLRSRPAHVLLAAPDWQRPGQIVSSFLRDGFLDRAAQLGWRFEVLRTSSVPPREWAGGSGGASKSTVCPVVILRGKPPPPPHRSRVMPCFDLHEEDEQDGTRQDADDAGHHVSTGPTGDALLGPTATQTIPSLY